MCTSQGYRVSVGPISFSQENQRLSYLSIVLSRDLDTVGVRESHNGTMVQPDTVSHIDVQENRVPQTHSSAITCNCRRGQCLGQPGPPSRPPVTKIFNGRPRRPKEPNVS